MRERPDPFDAPRAEPDRDDFDDFDDFDEVDFDAVFDRLDPFADERADPDRDPDRVVALRRDDVPRVLMTLTTVPTRTLSSWAINAR